MAFGASAELPSSSSKGCTSCHLEIHQQNGDVKDDGFLHVNRLHSCCIHVLVRSLIERCLKSMRFGKTPQGHNFKLDPLARS